MFVYFLMRLQEVANEINPFTTFTFSFFFFKINIDVPTKVTQLQQSILNMHVKPWLLLKATSALCIALNKYLLIEPFAIWY